MILAATLKETGSVFWRQFRQAKYICFLCKRRAAPYFWDSPLLFYGVIGKRKIYILSFSTATAFLPM